MPIWNRSSRLFLSDFNSPTPSRPIDLPEKLAARQVQLLEQLAAVVDEAHDEVALVDDLFVDVGDVEVLPGVTDAVRVQLQVPCRRRKTNGR